ncbi:MAG TPA: hypothetical protein PKH98_03095, partial [Candidatus Omnitrophota bacterium]|nr:hypothetical protein [Candidatus Omnitrophota bacterium]
DAGHTITVGTSGWVQSGAKFMGGSGAITINGNFELSDGVFTSTTGTLAVGGNWDRTGGTFNQNTGKVDFIKGAGVPQTLNSGGFSFSHLVHSGPGTLQLISNSLVVIGTVENNAGILDLNGRPWTMTGADFINIGTVRLIGNEVITGLTPYTTAGTFEYVGDGDGVAKDFEIKNFGAIDYFNLVINSTDYTTLVTDTFAAGGNLKMNGNLTVTKGKMFTKSYNIDVEDNVFTVEAQGIFELLGSETITIGTTGSVSLLSGSTVIFTGNGGGVGTFTLTDFTDRYQNLIINSSHANDTFDLDAELYVGGDFTRVSGILDLSTHAVTFNGIGTQDINNILVFSTLVVSNNGGDVNFNSPFTTTDFRCLTPNASMRFLRGETYIINGTLNLRGAKNNRILLDTLDSVAPAFIFDVPAEQQRVHFVNVAHSDAASNDIIATDAIDGGGNDNNENTPQWVFYDGALPMPRSVGANTDGLYSQQVSIANRVATFQEEPANNIGIGDVLQYDPPDDDPDVGATVAFITGRLSNTQYTVQSRFGGSPAQTNDAGVKVFRAFKNLVDWDSQMVNRNIDPSVSALVPIPQDLVDGSIIAIAPLYYDETVDENPTTLSNSWVTSEDYYVKVYTPYLSSEVGESQRHLGVWTAGAHRFETSATAILSQVDYIHFDGLQIKLTTSDSDQQAIRFETPDGGIVKVSNSIIRADLSGGANQSFGIFLSDSSENSPEAKLWNNIFYDWKKGESDAGGILIKEPWKGFIYNNSFVYSRAGVVNENGSGIVKNNLSRFCDDGFVGDFDPESTHNISDIANDAPGNYYSEARPTVFINKEAKNFHLST